MKKYTFGFLRIFFFLFNVLLSGFLFLFLCRNVCWLLFPVPLKRQSHVLVCLSIFRKTYRKWTRKFANLILHHTMFAKLTHYFSFSKCKSSAYTLGSEKRQAVRHHSTLRLSRPYLQSLRNKAYVQVSYTLLWFSY